MKSLQTSLFFLVVGVLALCGSAWAFSGSGSGTEADPYVITDVYQLQEMQNDLSACYVLGNDIDATATAIWNGGEGFEPVGNPTDHFTGIFDGRGHTITGLYINKPLAGGVGLFGYLRNGAEVKNVGLIAARTYGKYYVGTLAGTSSNQSHIHDCYATGEVTISADGSSDAKSGGLVGCQGYSTISKCYSSVNVTALSSRYQIGGLCGYSRARSGDPPALIENCYSTGTVTSNGWKVGGLLGDADGENSTVSKCYSVGRVNGSHKKGLVGYNFRNPNIRDSYWDVQTSGCSSSYGGTGKQTAQMMQQATFVNWDFEQIWDIVENETYPFFREPGVLIGLEIVGPGEVAENFSASYKTIAYYDDDSTRDVTNLAVWAVEPNTAANIDGNGILTTKNIVTHQSATILASYIEGDVIVEAEKGIGILAICPTGTALLFDGVNDYVDFSRNIITTTEFTVSAWANHYGSPGGSSPVNAIFQQRDDASQAGYAQSLILLATEYPGDYAAAIIRSSGGSSTQRLSYPKKNYDEWHQYSMTVDSTDFTFYIDGVEVDRTSNDQAGDYVTSIDYVSIGRHSYRGANRGLFNGVIDEVAIYNRALSAEEIRANMHQRLAGDEPNLVGYWDFDEGEGQIVYDLSGNGNDGQLGSTPEADSSDPAWVDSDAPVGICSLYQIATLAADGAVERKTAMLEELLAALAEEWTAYEALEEWLVSGDYGDLYKGDIVTAKQKIHSATQHEGQSIGALDKSVEKLKDALNALGYEPNTAANIDENGVLTTKDIVKEESATILASYTEGDVTFEAEKAIDILAICPIGTALSFDGVDDYVEVSYHPVLNTNKITVLAWVKGSAQIFGRVVSHYEHGVEQRAWTMYSAGEGVSDKLKVVVSDNGQYSEPGHRKTYRTTTTAFDNTWHFVGFTFDGPNSNLKLYVDGTEDTNVTKIYDDPISEIYNSTAGLTIGCDLYYGAADYLFKGLIDEVAIYNRALSAEEIRANMHTRLAGDEPGLIGYWDFDEGEGQIVYDLSGNGNDGQLGSTPNPDVSDPAWIESDAPIGICSLYQIATMAVERALERKLAMLEELLAALAEDWTAYEALQEWLENGDYGDLNKGDIVTAKQKIHSATQHEEQSIDALEKSIEKLEDALSALGYEPPPPPPPPGQASNPNPADGPRSVFINADLSWTAGSNAVSHDVYFGTTSPGTFRGNQTSTTFDPGTMASYTTYYWRIDEVNPSGTTTGTVWTFRTGGWGPPI